MQVPSGKTGPKPELKDTGVPQLSRKQAADDAGIKERQRKTPIRIVKIPEADFEEMVEAEKAPTMFWLVDFQWDPRSLGACFDPATDEAKRAQLEEFISDEDIADQLSQLAYAKKSWAYMAKQDEIRLQLIDKLKAKRADTVAA